MREKIVRHPGRVPPPPPQSGAGDVASPGLVYFTVSADPGLVLARQRGDFRWQTGCCGWTGEIVWLVCGTGLSLWGIAPTCFKHSMR